MKADPVRIDIGTSDQVIDHRFGHPLGIGRGVKFLYPQRFSLSRTVHIDKGHSAPHILIGARIVSPEQNPVRSGVIVNHGKARARFAARGIKERLEPVAFIGNLHPLEGRRDQIPGFVKIFFQLVVSRHHARVAVRHINQGPAVEVRCPTVEFVRGHLALFPLEARRKYFVLFRDSRPFRMPAFQIVKFDPTSHVQDIRIGNVGGNLHADLQLAAARQPPAGIKLFSRLLFVQQVCSGFSCHRGVLLRLTVSRFE